MRTLFIFFVLCGVAVAEDPPAGEPEKAELLTRMAGVWRTESTLKASLTDPQERTLDVRENTEFVLRNKFLLGREHSRPDGVKTLWLMTYDVPGRTYQTWFFNSNDLSGARWELAWNPTTRTALGRSISLPAGFTSHASNQFPDGDTNIVDIWIKDESGKTAFDAHAVKKRRPSDLGPEFLKDWSTPARTAESRSPEVKVLEAFVGTWDAVTVARPALWTPKETTTTSVITRQWVLDERLVLDQSKHSGGDESLALFDYDPQGKQYRTWWFNSEGHRNTSTGTWNAKNKTFTFKTPPEEGRVTRSTVQIVDADTHTWHFLVADGAGKIYFNSLITTKRRK